MQNTATRRAHESSPAITAAAIVGAILLVGGAATSTFALEPHAAATEDSGRTGSALAFFSLVFAITVLVTLTVALRWSLTFRINGLGNLPAVAMTVVLAVEVVITRAWDGISDIAVLLHKDPPISVTLAVAAWALVVTGTVLVVCAAFTPPTRWTLAPRSRGVYAVIGIVICCAAVAFAIHASRDVQNAM
ncbi:hypothetical protein [Nocardia caishijiensis]|uniref:Uncharacterized protein n=1 Tax=Nocardia caishijiensis TaxID=184756 RepID=A0ABQ6YM61_9NOCA|nr:hypothetical protein [Nocardia caishijiensis]KAF0846556.1 hypothetical protein FNL39_105472 [Nocardia caishijiensis]